MIPVIISAAIFTAVLLYSMFRYQRFDSVSALYYKFPSKHRRLLFWLWFMFYSTPLLLVAQSGFLVFAVAGLWYVATAAAYKDSGMTSTVHYSGAVASILFGMLYIGVTLGEWWPVAMFFAAAFIITYMKPFARTLYVEVVAYYIIVFSLLMF